MKPLTNKPKPEDLTNTLSQYYERERDVELERFVESKQHLVFDSPLCGNEEFENRYEKAMTDYILKCQGFSTKL